MWNGATGWLALAFMGTGAAAAADPAEFFETRVRPVLANNRDSCHANSESGGLIRAIRQVDTQSGRDHNHLGFTVLLAGGGFKSGFVYGRTDHFGFRVVENPVHVHSLHATILHQMGLDQEKVIYRYSGRDFRLTDVAGRVVQDIIA